MTIPVGWRTRPFTELVTDETGGNTKTLQSDFLRSGKYPIIDQGQRYIAGYTDDITCLIRSKLPVIVFGDHTKAIKFVDFPFCLGADGTKVLQPSAELDARYLFHFLRQAKLPDAGYSRHFKFLKALAISFPPLDEQRRIAAILDQADGLRRKRLKGLRALQRLPGSLFDEMFGDLPSNARKWRRGRVGDLVERFESGKNLVADDLDAPDAKRRVLKVSAVTSLYFRPEESKPLPDTYDVPAHHMIKKGDLLFSRANTAELVGATAYVDQECDRLALPDKIWRFCWPDATPSYRLFVWYLFRQRSFRDQIAKRSTGTSGSMKNISQEKVLNIEIGIPHRDAQAIFSRRVEAIRANEKPVLQQAAKLDALFASLQHRAFRGEL